MMHRLKILPEYYEAVVKGKKKFEVRENDRGYQVGDHLALSEWDPKTKNYTGKEIWVFVTYMMEGGQYGLDEKYVIMSIEILDKKNEHEEWKENTKHQTVGYEHI